MTRRSGGALHILTRYRISSSARTGILWEVYQLEINLAREAEWRVRVEQMSASAADDRVHAISLILLLSVSAERWTVPPDGDCVSSSQAQQSKCRQMSRQDRISAAFNCRRPHTHVS